MIAYELSSMPSIIHCSLHPHLSIIQFAKRLLCETISPSKDPCVDVMMLVVRVGAAVSRGGANSLSLVKKKLMTSIIFSTRNGIAVVVDKGCNDID